MFQYSFNLAWSDEDGGYIVTIPEFPDFSAFGKTPEDAIREAKIALELYIEVMKEDGEEIPAPNKLEHFSGQIRLRMPKSLHKKLSSEAEREGVSLNSYFIYLLGEKFGVEKATKVTKAAIDRQFQKQFEIYKDEKTLDVFRRSISRIKPDWREEQQESPYDFSKGLMQ